MRVSMTVPTDGLPTARTLYRELEDIGYDRAFSFEAKHDPFLPLAVAAEHTERITLGTAIAIAFARTPMTLANVGWDLQAITGGRFVLGLGSQIAPHVTQRFSMPWSDPVGRMREIVLGIRAIWANWQDGTPLTFRGQHYTHTRMVPAFDPGPLEWGPPPILTAGVGPRMTEVGGEVADGFLVHPLNTRRSLEQLTVPALRRGLERSGRPGALDDGGFELVCVTIVVTGRTEQEFEHSREAVRRQLAFYGSTPAYRPVFDLHDRGELHPVLKRRAAAGEWAQMAELIDDEFLEQVAVVGPPGDIAAAIRARLAGISDSVSLVNNRAPDPEHFAEVVAGLSQTPGWP
jgi:probable F420-dependent oxidoreductase